MTLALQKELALTRKIQQLLTVLVQKLTFKADVLRSENKLKRLLLIMTEKNFKSV